MCEYIYRYIGFDTFVDMVQTKSLAFVLPTVWEDPCELQAVHTYIQQQESIINSAFLQGIADKTYAQCWSSLEESDAMWRIYSYGNRAIRIKTRRDSFVRIDPNISVENVIYTDELDERISMLGDDKKHLLQLWCLKRKAFEHEREVRVILPYKYPNDDAVEEHIKAYTAFYTDDSTMRTNLIQSFHKGSPKDNVEYAIALTNANKRVSIRKVSFAYCSDFIQGVLVHPMAPAWYVETVRAFCANNNIPFEGKSKLYQQ